MLTSWKPNKWFAFPVLYLQFLNVGLLAPTLPDILVEFFHNSYPDSALATGLCDSIGAFLAFLLSPFLGGLSDRYGRRMFLFTTVFLTGLQVWAIALYPNISLWWYLVAKALGKISVYGPVLSYVADVTTLQERTPAFGQATAAIFAALSTGPLICMLVSSDTAFRIACVCTIANISYIALILPETITGPIPHTRHKPHAHAGPLSNSKNFLSEPADLGRSLSAERKQHTTVVHVLPVPQQQQKTDGAVGYGSTAGESTSSIAGANDNDSALNPSLDAASSHPADKMHRTKDTDHGHGSHSHAHSKTVSPALLLRFVTRNRVYTTITLLVFFSQLSEYGIFETEPLYLKEQLDFTRDDRSHIMVIVGLATFTVMTVVMPRLLKTFRERRTILIALSCNLVHVLLYTCIWEKSQVAFIALVGSFGYMSYPVASSLLSKYVAADEQGLAQGALSGFKSLTQGLGPLMFSIVFSVFSHTDTDYFIPQMPFFLGGLFVMTAFGFSLSLPEPRGLAVPPSPNPFGKNASDGSLLSPAGVTVAPPRKHFNDQQNPDVWGSLSLQKPRSVHTGNEQGTADERTPLVVTQEASPEAADSGGQ